MHIHFIAIGGSAMHNLAIAMHKKGYRVTGSDDAIFEPSRSRLERYGLLPESIGWESERIEERPDMIILGMHAKEDNPELLKAQELGLKIFSYPEFLYEEAKDKTRIVIGGSHGKTTITSMILHVLHYHAIEVDYMVGAQLEGFDTMVNLTHTNDFVVLEGDEYLSSSLDMRPKFHLYKPNIALLSGIAWDHINVFPTFENYKEQFRIFIEQIVEGGVLIYNEEDTHVKELAEQTQHHIRKIPYGTPKYRIEKGTTFIDTPEGDLPIEIFGVHNLNNLSGAQKICQQMGILETDFYEAIGTFKGASKRMEKIGESSNAVIYKDFAHSPSKVAATTEAAKEQYPNRSVVACLELHTYSSLNSTFIQEYKGALDAADIAVVYYSPEAVALKKLENLREEDIYKAFQREDLQVYTSPEIFKDFVYGLESKGLCLVLMSSGNYGGLDIQQVADTLTNSAESV